MPPHPTHSRLARLHPKTFLGIRGIIGLMLAVGCAWAFLAMADEVPEKGFMVRADTVVTGWLQVHGTETGESIFNGLSLLGGHVLSILLVVVGIGLLIRRDWRHGVLLIVACGGGSLLNVGLKTVYHRSRPGFASEFPVASWSFPSGHAMDSLIGYGLLAYLLCQRFPRWRRLIVAIAAALILAIGFARIYLGVHYLSDVIAGYTAGFVWLTVCVTGYRFAERRHVGAETGTPPRGL
jgi:undecaprenyl-diphosphatase